MTNNIMPYWWPWQTFSSIDTLLAVLVPLFGDKRRQGLP